MTTPASKRSAWALGTLHKLDGICRYLALNLLWLLSCCLVVTGPAGTKAMLETAKDWAAGSEAPVLRTFAGHFKAGALRTTAAAAPLMVAGFLLLINFEIASHTGSQRAFLTPALIAVAIPYLVFTANLLPANLGHHADIRGSYRRTLTSIVTNPTAAMLTILISAAAVFIAFVQPFAIFVVAAPAARLIVAATSRTIHQPAS